MPENYNVDDKYLDVPLRFVIYHKYDFHFAGKHEDGATVNAIFGGDQDDIYRFEVKSDSIATMRDGLDGLKPRTAYTTGGPT